MSTGSFIGGTPPRRFTYAWQRRGAGVQRGLYVCCAGEQLFVPTAAAAPTSAAGPADDVVRAPMAGRVTQVAVRRGEAVAAGALLLTLEAMKMEYRLVAPRAGKVQSLEAAPQQLVETGAVLVRLG